MKPHVLTTDWPTLMIRTFVFGWLWCAIGSAVADDETAFQLANHDLVVHEFGRPRRSSVSPSSSTIVRRVARLAENPLFGRPEFLPGSVVLEAGLESSVSSPPRTSVFASCCKLGTLFDRSPTAQILPVRDGDDIKPSFPRRRESSFSATLPCWFPAFAGMTNSTNAGFISSPPLSLTSDDRSNPGPIETSADGEEFAAACEVRPFKFRRDVSQLSWLVRDDAKHAINWNNTLILAVAGGVAIGIHQDWDDRVRASTARHPNRWGGTSKTLGNFGDVTVQLPIMLGLYSYALRQQDEQLHALSGTLFSATTIAGVSTVLAKVIFNTDRPSDRWNGGEFGFPSYHTASSFAIAAVLDEYYGSNAGVPAYLLAGAIGWSRLDERDHDLSDVVFGAALGFVIGKAVAGRHLRNDSRVKVTPFARAFDRTAGLAFEIPY